MQANRSLEVGMKVLAIYFRFHNAITLSWIMKLICTTSHVVVVWSIFIVYPSKQKLRRKGIKCQTNLIKQLIYWWYAFQALTLFLYSNYITMCGKNILFIWTLDSVWLCEQSIFNDFHRWYLKRPVSLMFKILLTYRCWLQFRSSISDCGYFLFFYLWVALIFPNSLLDINIQFWAYANDMEENS